VSTYNKRIWWWWWMSRRHTLSLLVWSCQNHLRIVILRWPTYCWRQEPYRYYIAKDQATWCFVYGIWYWWLNWYCWPQIVRSHYWSQSLSTPFTSTHSTPFLQPPKKTTWLSASSFINRCLFNFRWLLFSLHHIPHSGLYSTITPQPN